MESFVVDVARVEKRAACNRLGQFAAASGDDRDGKAKVAEDSFLDSLGQFECGNLASPENYISALDIRFDLLEAKRLKRLAKHVHLDSLVAANVNSAKH